MRWSSVWRRLVGAEEMVVDGVRLKGLDPVIEARPARCQRNRCGRCGQSCPRYDAGVGRRRWRALDLGSTRTFIEAEAARVSCPKHGVVVAALPWPDHDARFTRSFEEQAAWLAVHCSQSPNATRCMDPFYVVQWATDALDQIRREVWNAARRGGHQQHAHDLKGARWADEAIAQVEALGFDVADLAGRLQREGADAIVKSWSDLRASIGSRTRAVVEARR